MPNPAAQDSVAASSPSAARLALSHLAPATVQSEIRAMTVECDRIGGINLAQGVCDTPVPAPVQEGAIRAIHDGHNIYTRLDGIARLRNAIAAKQARDYGLDYDPEGEILVASGATGGLHTAAMALLNPGDEVLLFEPFYGYHVATLKSLRVTPIFVPLTEPDWVLDLDALRAAITPRTRALILNTPANPCGKVFSRAELESLAALALEHDLFVFTDEIYEYFVYDGARHIPITSLPGIQYHWLAARLRLGRCSLAGRDVLLSRPDLRLRSLGLAAWRGSRTRGATAQLLRAASRRLPIQAHPHSLRTESGRTGTQRPRRRLLRASQRRPSSRQDRSGEGP
jgi:aminotransferase